MTHATLHTHGSTHQTQGGEKILWWCEICIADPKKPKTTGYASYKAYKKHKDEKHPIVNALGINEM